MNLTKRTWLEIPLALIAGIGLYFIFLGWDGAAYTVWADRDLIRASTEWSQFPMLGPEFTGAGRIPGPGYYVLLKLLLVVHQAPEVVLALMIFSYVGAAAFFAVTCAEVLGKLAGITVFALLVASPTVLGHLGSLWNPGFALVAGLVAYAMLIQILIYHRRRQFVPMMACLTLAVHCHFSYAILVPIFLTLIRIERVPISGKRFFWGMTVLVVSFTPSFIYEAIRYFPTYIDWMDNGVVPGRTSDFLPSLSPLAVVADVLQARPAPDVISWVIFNGLMIATLTAGALALGMIPLRRRFPKFFVDANVRQMLTTSMQIVAIGVLCLLPFSGSYARRHALFLFPALVIAAGCVVHYAEKIAAMSNRFMWGTRGATALMIVALALGTPELVRAYGQRNPGVSADAYRRITEALKDRMEPQYISERLTVLHEVAPSKWASPPVFNRAARYFSQSLPTTSTKRVCALALVGAKGADVSEERFNTALSALPEPLPAIERVANLGNVQVALYPEIEGNCLSNMGNPYVPLSMEEFPRSSPVQRFPIATYLGGRLFRGFVDFEPVPDGVRAVLVTSHLRGHDGLRRHRLKKPTAILRAPDGSEEILFPFTDEELGSEFKHTPWYSGVSALRAPEYEVEIMWGDTHPKRLRLGRLKTELIVKETPVSGRAAKADGAS